MSTIDPAVPPKPVGPAVPPPAPVAPPPPSSYVAPAGYASTPSGPGVGIMWANAFLSWSGLALIYLVYLTIRNVAWASRNNQSPVKYLLPIGFVAGVFLLLLIVGQALGSGTPSTPTYP